MKEMRRFIKYMSDAFDDNYCYWGSSKWNKAIEAGKYKRPEESPNNKNLNKWSREERKAKQLYYRWCTEATR